VEDARRKVSELREKVQPQRQAIADAQAAVTAAEVADRQRMAQELAQGGTPKADPKGMEKAEQQAANVRREGEALMLAVQASEDALGEAVHAHRDRWLADSRRKEKAARSRARKVIEELRGVLEDLGAARGTAVWLTAGGLEQQVPASAVVRLELAGSQKLTANQEPIPVGRTLDMLAQTVADPDRETPGQPPKPVPA
jgi:hypothetical protein